MGQDQSMLGLPDQVTACLFDLDGVLTDTASVHRAAWKETFDAFLAPRGEPPFTEGDYADYVDGKPRADGVRDFLTSRGIELPEGEADDPADRATVYGIGNRKNELLVQRNHRRGAARHRPGRAGAGTHRRAHSRRAAPARQAGARLVPRRGGAARRAA